MNVYVVLEIDYDHYSIVGVYKNESNSAQCKAREELRQEQESDGNNFLYVIQEETILDT